MITVNAFEFVEFKKSNELKTIKFFLYVDILLSLH